MYVYVRSLFVYFLLWKQMHFAFSFAALEVDEIENL